MSAKSFQDEIIYFMIQREVIQFPFMLRIFLNFLLAKTFPSHKSYLLWCRKTWKALHFSSLLTFSEDDDRIKIQFKLKFNFITWKRISFSKWMEKCVENLKNCRMWLPSPSKNVKWNFEPLFSSSHLFSFLHCCVRWDERKKSIRKSHRKRDRISIRLKSVMETNFHSTIPLTLTFNADKNHRNDWRAKSEFWHDEKWKHWSF